MTSSSIIIEDEKRRGFRIKSGASFQIQVRIKNASAVDWCSEGVNPVFLSYHWLDVNWGVAIFEGERTRFSGGAIEGGKTMLQRIDVTAPSQKGCFYLVLTMVQEGVRWMERDLENFNPFIVRVVVDDAECPLRLAIVSTPRSGNTWLHRMVSQIWTLPVFAVHRPADLDWENLPEKCLIQLHWPPNSDFCSLLQKYRVRPIVLLRHPLDVLISILHFCRHEPQTAEWLDGEGGGEDTIKSCSPVDPAFEHYATSPRARALLSLSSKWLHHPEVTVVRYEELVFDTQREVERIACASGLTFNSEFAETVVEQNKIERIRMLAPNKHFWRGTPGLWRKLIPAVAARAIYEVHQDTFQATGYDCEPDADLSSGTALSYWNAIAIEAP